MKVVVTGATGGLGRHVIRELAAAGHEVVATDLVVRPLPGVAVHRLDLLDERRTMALLEGAAAAVHLANRIPRPHLVPDPCFRDNLGMLFNVLEAARVAGTGRVIFASSVQVMTNERRLQDPAAGSGLPWLPLSAEHPLAPSNPYALSKALGEEMLRYYVRNTGMTAVALRFPLLLETPPPATGAALGERRIDEAFTWLTFADGARLVRTLLEAALTGLHTYFPAARRPLAGGDVETLRQGFFPGVPLKGGGPLDSFVDDQALRREIGWAPVDE